MKEKILEALKTKFIGVQDAILNRVAVKLSEAVGSEDDVAVEQISKYYPEFASQNRLSKISIKDITRNDGALNCITWTTRG